MEREIKKFKIEGNHPIFRRIDSIAEGQEDLDRKCNELKTAGYEINVVEIETAKDR